MTASAAAGFADEAAGAATGDSGVRARLYDAHGADRVVDIAREGQRSPGDDQLLWIDVDGRRPADVRAAGVALGLDDATIASLARPGAPMNLRRHDEYVHLGLQSAQAGEAGAIEIVTLDLVVARNTVLTVRDGPIRAFDRFREEIAGATQIGRLDAASFTGALIDSVLEGYLQLVEDVERRVDRLDQRALRARSITAVVGDLTVLRSRVAVLRRALAPHRPAFAAMARPDFALHEALGRPWPGLVDRLDATLAAVETSRELLIGTFDIVMTRAAQRTNDTMKILTVLSAVLLPANTVAAILGMNFAMPFFSDLSNFWVALGGMALFMVVTLVVAIRRDRE